MKILSFLVTCLAVLLVAACSSTNIYPSMQKKYASQLSRLRPNMTVTQVKRILPIRRQGAGAGGREVYVLLDFAGRHQTFADRTTSLFGVSAEDRPEMRKMYFYFQRGRLRRWSSASQ